ncbi:MAG: DegT/DnrJ/EryC1/StrS family aminotransferase [Oscillospiraceae bacterium]|nr:DegT/DnrJ/EryC1/StrS family aminotransferase [Oscillospiraceae bacterium]
MSNKPILVTRSSMPPYDEFINEIMPIWDSHWLTNGGEFHQTLEKKLTEFLQVNNISLFTNGHMALELAFQALNLSGEIITTPFTFVSTTHAIVRSGMTPVFCDINCMDYTIDVSKIERLITEETVAIAPVHVYGNVCDVEEIEKIATKYNLKVIYDAAHAFGVQYKGKGIGNFGDLSMFSFHATKVFNTIEGGAITYSNSEIGKKLNRLKNFGIKDEETVDIIGANAKMNEFQAVMGICNLRHFDEEIAKRKVVVEKYREILSVIKGIKTLGQFKDVKSNYAYFPVIIEPEIFGESRDDIYNRLKLHNIFARKYFYPITNTLDCYKEKYSANNTPIALDISKKVLTLPLYADLPLDDVERICKIILN